MSGTTLTDWLNEHKTADTLIGQHVRYAGSAYEVVDFLSEEEILVLASRQQECVQEDRYGRAHRLVPRTDMIHLRDEHGQRTHICNEITLQA